MGTHDERRRKMLLQPEVLDVPALPMLSTVKGG